MSHLVLDDVQRVIELMQMTLLVLAAVAAGQLSLLLAGQLLDDDGDVMMYVNYLMTPMAAVLMIVIMNETDDVQWI